jgi:DNA polymerase bacteriophage-type
MLVLVKKPVEGSQAGVAGSVPPQHPAPPEFPAVHRSIKCRSLLGLETVGPHVYAADRSTRVLVCAWIIEHSRGELSAPIIWHGNMPAYTASPPMPVEVRRLIESGCRVVGHGALEAVIDEYHAGLYLGWAVPKLEQLDCLMSRAATQALPLDLDDLCGALKLKARKDDEGRRLAHQMAKPRSPRHGEDLRGVYWLDDADMLARLTQYCIGCVRAGIEADHALRPLSKPEREIWLLDQRMNFRGIEVDLSFVRLAKDFVTRATVRADARMSEITGGAVGRVTQLARLKDWARERGVEFPVITKVRRDGEEDDVEVADKDALQELLTTGDLDDDVRAAFELRLRAGRTSLAKYEKFLVQAPHGRARGLVQFHAAATGRWGGRGIQLQNLPRAEITERDWDQRYRDLRELSDAQLENVWEAAR